MVFFYAAIEAQIHHYIAIVHSILSVLSESAGALLPIHIQPKVARVHHVLSRDSVHKRQSLFALE